MSRYTDLNDAMFDAHLIGNRPALDLLQIGRASCRERV